MLGLVTKGRSKKIDVINESIKDFNDLSHIHSDGWGVAWFEEDMIKNKKAPECAVSSRLYCDTLHSIKSDILMTHLRKADPGMPNLLQNSHPFVYKSMGIAFMHNGLIHDKEELRRLIPESIQNYIKGDTDSELFFWYIVSIAKLEKSNSWEDILKSALVSLHKHISFSSLNCCLITKEALYMICDFNPESSQALQNPGYYEIYYSISPESVIVSSSGWDIPGRVYQLGNRKIITIKRHTLEYHTSDLLNSFSKHVQYSN
ncbi:class II glutamine amidotransferase [Scopulibacillus cellulosilyticus]|uniref:Class II glutamine amidotransferase n=1 Tax=Scopulibacillus cellulosilyticus TaxID=2665665 RepID=A0ABW2PXJ3_9BACL